MSERKANGAFAGSTDLISRVPNLNKGTMGSFIKAGAMDFCGYTRRTLLTNMDSVIKGSRKETKKQVEGQISMFSGVEGGEEKLSDSFTPLPEYEPKEILQYEKEAMGIYVSGHPLDDYRGLIDKYAVTEAVFLQPQEDLEEGEYREELDTGQEITVAGIVIGIKVIYTKKNNRAMAFLDMEDMTGPFSCVVFPDIYEKYKTVLSEDSKLLITGHVSKEDEKDPSILVNTIIDMDKVQKKVWVRFSSEKEYLEEKVNLILFRQQYVGNDIFLIYDKETGKPGMRRSTIRASAECIEKLNEKYGEKNVRVTY